MTTGSIGPGTVLADRYRLDDLLTESAGARFWRATDTILARSVAIHAVPSDDPRAPTCSRRPGSRPPSPTRTCCGCSTATTSDGITWVVHEWGEGISLDLMLQRGTLPASRAAWLAREVAEAIAAGHAQGVAHGRLNPEAVLVTHAGAVKLIGYVVDAALEVSRPQDPLYGELDDREADVINLAGILYAALTGRWPGVARSAVPKAPRESRRPLRPRQVRAGVPRTLDAICERVLHKEGSQHTMPIETAHEIAAALADYVGDPALTAPLDAAGMHAEPTRRRPPRRLLPSASPDLGSEPDPEATQQVAARPITRRDAEPDPEATQQVAAPPVTPEQARAAITRSRRADPATTRRRHAALPPARRGRRGPGSAACARRRGAPPSPFPDIPERPLFASTERRVPAAARAGSRQAVVPVVHGDAQRATDRHRHQLGGLPPGGGGRRRRRTPARHRTRVLALRRQPRGGQRGPHRQGGPRLAADGDRDRRTPRAGGRHGDRLQPRSSGRLEPPCRLRAARATAERHRRPRARPSSWPAYATSTPSPSRRRRTPRRPPTPSTATPPPPGPRAPTAATPRSAASSPASG